jgi:hypothetical protein
MAFHVIDGDTVPAYQGTLVFRKDEVGSGFFICDAGLPDRAVVTKVQFTVLDSYSGNDPGEGQVRYCGLLRQDLRASTAGQYQELAAVPATGPAATPGKVRLSDTIINATVDTSRFAYWLQCQLTNDGDPLGDAVYLGLYGATVTYRISSANG